MAKCEYCNKDMLECDGCDTNQLILNDSNVYDRIAVGDKYDFYDGTEDEKRKFDLIGELENELLSLQLVDLYARTFDDMLILSLAVRNDSNETDTSIRISIHIENESAECVQPDRNLINPEIRGEGECVGLEGIVYDE